MYIYVNGEFVPEAEAKISPFEHGFMYGLGVFETFRIYKGHPFLLDDHFQRMQLSLDDLSINWRYDRAEVLTILHTLLNKNRITDAYIRWNVSAGVAPLGLQTEPYEKPTTIVYIKPINGEFSAKKEGMVLRTRRNTPEGDWRLKSHHFLNNIYGKKEVGNTPDIEGIFLTREGYLAEGIVSNLFWVKNNVVYTPALETGILNGITRQYVKALLAKENIPCREGLYLLKDLEEADEVFVTNSIQEVVTITSIGRKRYESNNSLVKELQHLYKKHRTTVWSLNEL